MATILSSSISIALTFFLLLANTQGQSGGGTIPTFTEESCGNLPTLICHVQPTTSYSAKGVVYFTPTWSKIDESSEDSTCYTRIQATIEGLNPDSLHGFHVHTFGDLSDDSGTSTGGHFADPAGSEVLTHGYPNDPLRHWGDFGNLTTDGDGVAKYDRVDDVIRLGSILGRAVTIHAENDKGRAFQPSGNSGARIGFGVIGYANPELIES